ncbi:MAG: O-antigen ligase family protein [Anaerolineales bacterium]
MAIQPQPTGLSAQLNWPQEERSQHVMQAYSWSNRLLVWAEWALLIIAVMLLIAATSRRPSTGLVLALLAASFAARLIRTGRITRSTSIDIPLLLFLVSALVAFWVAADRTQATYRLLLILAAVGLFYSIVNSRPGPLATFADAFVIVVAVAGIYLASQHSWIGAGARFAPIKPLGLLLNQVMPELGRIDLHWNVVRNGMAAVLGIALPIAVARTAAGFRGNRPFFARRRRGTTNWLRVSIMAATAVVILIGLVMTESRMPWLAYLAIAGLAVWWWVAGRMSSWLSIRREHLFLAIAAVALIAIVITFAVRPELLGWLPGPNNAPSKTEIFSQAWRLAEDTPFTGGGLGQFSALYSTYIQVIPHALFSAEDSGNGAYLNVLVEQGWLGLIALVALLGTATYAAAVRLGPQGRSRGLEIAGVIGVAFIVLYGLAHDMLLATRTIPFLLVPAGLVLAEPLGPRKVTARSLAIIGIAVSALVLIVAAAIALLRPTAAAWHANLGVIEMAKVELADWPTNQWKGASSSAELAPAKSQFDTALGLDPKNRTAHHRLGVIAMAGQDFPTAVFHLEMAYAQDEDHRGIRKSLGYSLAWSGEFDRALSLLAEIPEAKNEMSVYEWWWGTQGREDLASNAQSVSELLGSGSK